MATHRSSGSPSTSVGRAAPNSAKALVDAFAKFNIPYQSGVIASEMIPDATTVELFVAPKP